MTVDVMVFAPTALLTVTIERHQQMEDLHIHAGGQGVWQARMVTLMGGRAVFCTVLGGETGRALEPMLIEEGFEVRAVHRPAGTGWYVHDRRRGARDRIAEGAGAPLYRHDVDELYNITLAEGLRADVCLLGGPAHDLLEPDVYRRLAMDLTRNGARLVADLAGDYLTAALAGGLSVVKVSHDEVLAAGRAADDSVPALGEAARQMRAEGARTVIISRREQPALGLLDGELLLVHPPPIETVDPSGAGDSMTGAIATMLARGADLEEAVRVGAAAGAVNVARHGLGTGHADAISELATRVRLQQVGAQER
jgi:1-phosphofructokinase